MRYSSSEGRDKRSLQGLRICLSFSRWIAARDASVGGERQPLVSRERNSIAMQRFAKSHVAPNSHDSSGSGVVQPRARTQAFAPAFVPRAATHTHVGARARGRCCLVHPDPAVSSRSPSLSLSLSQSFSPSLDFLPCKRASLGRPRPSLPLLLGITSVTASTSWRENINSLKANGLERLVSWAP